MGAGLIDLPELSGVQSNPEQGIGMFGLQLRSD